MKRCIATTIAFLVFPYAAQAQSDLQKIGKFLEGIQQRQNQQGGGGQGVPKSYRMDPNQSGRQNQGDFNRPGFIGQPRPAYPSPYNPQPQITYPSQPFPNQPYPQSGYPSGTIVQRPAYGEPPVAPRKAYSNLPIRIRCASDCVGTCNYQLVPASGKGFPYTIRANQIQTLQETTDWLCRYQPVSGGAYQTYRLRGGRTYEMRRDNNRWQLYLVP